MWRYVFLAGVIGVSVAQAPAFFFEKVVDSRENTKSQHVSQPERPSDNTNQNIASVNSRKQNLAQVSSSGRKVRIKAGHGGHYYAEVRMNNRTVNVLVDTGATMVAINETAARKIGIRLKSSDFNRKVNTANGTTKMALATIREIRIGNIRVQNVRAGVLRDSALSTTLLGMSFLNQLKRFGVSNQTLLLEQ